MKISELMEQKGTYVALRVLPPCTNRLYQHFKTAGLKVNSSMFENRLHVTEIYSQRHHPDIKTNEDHHHASFKGYDIFEGKKGERVLVMLLDAPTINARHKFLMSEHNATYDFPEYKPHITISYDFNGNIATLPRYESVIVLGHEYAEDLDLLAH